MSDDAYGGDEQDIAEVYDETHREGEDPNLNDTEDELDPGLDSRAYDVNRADGDEDEDEAEDVDDPDDDDALGEDVEQADEEEDVEAVRGAGLAADRPEVDDLVRTDQRSRIIAGPDEPGLTLAADLDKVAAPRDRQADKFESNGPLSDEQIAALGYGRDDARLDEGLKESFPASDSLAVSKAD